MTLFFTDHGEYLGDYGLVEKWPSGVDDVLVRNPLIIHDPSGATGVASAFVEMVDLDRHARGVRRARPRCRTSVARCTHCSMIRRQPHRDAAFSEGGFLVQEEPLLEDGDAGQYRHKQAIQHERTELVGRAVAVRTVDWCYVERLYEGPELYDRRRDPGRRRTSPDGPNTRPSSASCGTACSGGCSRPPTSCRPAATPASTTTSSARSSAPDGSRPRGTGCGVGWSGVDLPAAAAVATYAGV